MLPVMQKPSFLLLTWKADTGGWWETSKKNRHRSFTAVFTG